MSEANDLGWFRRSAAERSEGALSNERRYTYGYSIKTRHVGCMRAGGNQR